MPAFCFFEKGKQIVALELPDAKKSTQLVNLGWKKLFEEVSARDAESALARLADIRREERATECAFVTAPLFSSLLTAMLK